MFPRYACAINDGAQVVLTGGFDAIHHCPMNNVSVYSLNGFEGYLPNLTERRQYHACSRFTDQNGQNVEKGLDWRTIISCHLLPNLIKTFNPLHKKRLMCLFEKLNNRLKRRS